MLILPLLILSQQKPDGWLTPYANAEFKNGKIVYTVCNPQQGMNTRLLPLMYPRNLVLLSFDHRPVSVNGKYIGESQAKIRDYINTEPVNLRSNKEKDEYLRLSAMVLLWDLDLSNHTLQEIKTIQNGNDKKLARKADIVMKVHEVFKENKRISNID